MLATSIAIKAMMVMGSEMSLVVSSRPPMMMMPEMALVTAIKGVCKEWDTFQITCQPMKTERTNTVKCCINSAGATRPNR